MSTKKEETQKKERNMMYEQQIKYSPFNDLKELQETINNDIKPLKYAAIIHDKDVNEQGNPIPPHFHCMFIFENPRSITSIAKILREKPQYIQKWNNRKENGLSYLVHATTGATEDGKYLYDPTEVIANFDYPVELAKIKVKAEKTKRNNNITLLLDLLYNGEITREQLENQLTGSEYAGYKKKIEDVYHKYLQDKAKIFKEQMIAENREIQVIWISGIAGVGKTRFAVEQAEKTEKPFFISGSSRDIFQDYKGEQTIILDELRPNSLTYLDLLRILDPFGRQVNVPSRYQDKPLSCDLIIVTSPFNPIEFYCKLLGIGPNDYNSQINIDTADSFEQLLRRITLTIEINEKKIAPVAFNIKERCFKPIRSAGRKNPYYKGKKANTITQKETKSRFNAMFN